MRRNRKLFSSPPCCCRDAFHGLTQPPIGWVVVVGGVPYERSDGLGQLDRSGADAQPKRRGGGSSDGATCLRLAMLSMPPGAQARKLIVSRCTCRPRQ